MEKRDETLKQVAELSHDERAELEALRAERIARQEREELGRLRVESQKEAERRLLAQELLAQKRKKEQESRRLDEIYAQGEFPPMPRKQKIILAVLVIIILLAAYMIWSQF